MHLPKPKNTPAPLPLLLSTALLAVLLVAPLPALAQSDDGPAEPALHAVTETLWNGVQSLWDQLTALTADDPDDGPDAKPLTSEPTVDDGTTEALPIVDPAGYM